MEGEKVQFASIDEYIAAFPAESILALAGLCSRGPFSLPHPFSTRTCTSPTSC